MVSQQSHSRLQEGYSKETKSPHFYFCHWGDSPVWDDRSQTSNMRIPARRKQNNTHRFILSGQFADYSPSSCSGGRTISKCRELLSRIRRSAARRKECGNTLHSILPGTLSNGIKILREGQTTTMVGIPRRTNISRGKVVQGVVSLALKRCQKWESRSGIPQGRKKSYFINYSF